MEGHETSESCLLVCWAGQTLLGAPGLNNVTQQERWVSWIGTVGVTFQVVVAQLLSRGSTLMQLHGVQHARLPLSLFCEF